MYVHYIFKWKLIFFFEYKTYSVLLRKNGGVHTETLETLRTLFYLDHDV